MKKEKKEKKSDREMIHLFRLNDIRKSTDKGMIDRGFPRVYAEMAALNLVKTVGNGYQITELGRVHLDANRALLLKI